MVAELHVTDFNISLAFWTGVLGFGIAYQRNAEKFAYLEHTDGAQVMICQRHGRFETGPMEPPYGRGVMLQIYVNDLDQVLATLNAAGQKPYQEPREVWRNWGDREGGQREVFVQDPDGYLIMMAQNIGERPLNR